ncbi:hypothetical protein OAO18_00060 [Francisellaceae bacterium]|nr:hypothetical protein [Francisellaceae bacterium]
MRLHKLAFFTSFVAVISVVQISFGGNAKPTIFDAKIINESGQSLYITKGALPDATHLKIANPMFCPSFISQEKQQQLTWNLEPSLYPAKGQSTGVILHFYTSSSSSTTPIPSQSDLCPSVCGITGKPDCTPKTKGLPENGKATPPNGALISCTNAEGYIKYGGMQLPGYNPGIITIKSDGKDGLLCTLNPYTYLNEPIPYRQLNVGQNYLPPIGSKIKGVRPTVSTALINLMAYMGNDNGQTPLTLTYTVASGSNSEKLINIPTDDDFKNETSGPNPSALLQIKNGQIFVQHNIAADNSGFTITYSSLAKEFGCGQSGNNGGSSSFCTSFLDPMTQKPVPNKYVLWPTVSAEVQAFPASVADKSEGELKPCPDYNSAGKCSISQTFPIVISDTLRAKTVSEITNERMLSLIEAKKVQDVSGNPSATWLAKGTTDQPSPLLSPDGADAVNATPQNYLSVAMTVSDVSAFNKSPVSLTNYFVLPHNQKSSITYSFDSSYLQVDPDTWKNYQASSQPITGSEPLVHITGVGQVSVIPCNQKNSNACLSAGPFSISGDSLKLDSTKALSEGVYQINIRANDLNGSSAFNTFYIYVSQDGTTYSQWQSGILPDFNVLHYSAGQKFGTAYLYTSYDFTKSYARTDWVNSIKNLMDDLGEANDKYQANIMDAFVDVNNLSFRGMQGFWPVDTSVSNYQQGNVVNTIQPNQMITNLSDTTSEQPVYMLSELQNSLSSFSGQGNNPSVALTVYPSNNLKANFAGFNEQQRHIFADMSIIPALNTDVVNGISVDLEGGLNSVGDTQFYKLVADKLAYQGKWFSYFYFITVASPAFMASLGPLGALEVSTYDVGVFRPSATSFDVKMTDPKTKKSYGQQPVPGVLSMSSEDDASSPPQYVGGWSKESVTALYTAFSQDARCNEFDFPNGGGEYTLKIHSWCNNSPDMSYSENNRLWTSQVQAAGLPYGSPIENIKYFNGKFHLVLPVSWSATQFTENILFNPDLTPSAPGAKQAEGLFMQDQTASVSDCVNQPSLKQATNCLFGNVQINKLPLQNISQEEDLSKNNIPHIVISNLPGTTKNADGQWTEVERQPQEGYLYANFGLYEDLNTGLTKNNLVGISAYALENFENVPAAVAANAQLIEGSPPNAAMQVPWYIGFKPGYVKGTQLTPGYDAEEIQSIWSAFGNIAKQIGQ